MKKILIAAFAVLAAASAAGAGEIKVNFDGDGAAFELNAVLRDNSEFQAGIPEAQFQSENLFASLKEGVLNGVIQGAIESCIADAKTEVKIDLKNLLKYGTTKEKEAFVYNKRDVYSFPADIIARHFDREGGYNSGDKSRNSLDLTCNSWTTVKVCTNRQVCRIACSAAAGAAGSWASGGAAAGAAIGASGQICQELCEDVKECSDVRECASWSSTAGAGMDAHGNYRGRGVEFAAD